MLGPWALTVVGAAVAAADVAPPKVQWARGYSFAPSESHPHAGVETADNG